MIPEPLRKFGAVEVGEGYGYIPVREPKIKEPQIVEVTVTGAKEYIVYPMVGPIRAILRFLLELLSPKKQCTMTKAPRIIYELCPLQVQNVEFHWGGLYFTGDITNKFTNNSKPGEVGTCEVPANEQCPNDPNAYNWQEDPNSARLIGRWLQNAWEESTGVQFVKNLEQKLEHYIDPGFHVTLTGKWKTDSLMDTWQQFLNILMTGTITTNHGFDVTIKYNFRGNTHVIQRHVRMRVRLPVVGNVNWFSW